MSNGLKILLVFLFLLFVGSAGIAALALMQKQNLEQQKASLENQVSDYTSKLSEASAKIDKYQKDLDQLTKQLDSKARATAQAEAMSQDLQRKIEDIQAQFDQASRERDDWKSRIDTIRRERDDLMEKLRQQAEMASKAQKVEQTASEEAQVAPAVTSAQGEDYWAGVLKQKAALQLELDKVKAELDQAALQVVDLKKQNSDLQLELKQVKDDRDEIERKIKYGEDLANNLSVELARARNDQKFTNDRADKLKEQNLQLQEQMRQLTTTKVALERTVAHLNNDKTTMQKKLAETEGVIQGRINEIWQIKETLDQKISNMPTPTAPAVSKTQVDLPPIIVNSGNKEESKVNQHKTQGNVLSINEANNFVISDLGQDNSDVKVGNVLKVYREGKEIATLEIIQVRRDISAADIKQKGAEIKVGDTVKAVTN